MAVEISGDKMASETLVKIGGKGRRLRPQGGGEREREENQNDPIPRGFFSPLLPHERK